MSTSDAPAPESAAFLSGKGIPVAVAEIPAELERLWGPSAEREGGPALDHPTITRVSLANLVVGCLGSDIERVYRALDTVMARYPCRAIVLKSTSDDERRVSASISAHCTLPAPGMPQVCSECILLRTGPTGMDLLPGAVRPLLEPDLPLVLWWAGDPRPHWAVFRDLADEATRLVPDLADPESEPEAIRAALDPKSCHSSFSRDIAWFGITRWRELVAHFFDPPGSSRLLQQIRSVEVLVSAASNGQAARVGAWLVAWLAAQLGWSPVTRRASRGRVECQFQGTQGAISAVVQTQAKTGTTLARIETVTIKTQPSTPELDDRFGLARIDNSDLVRIETSSAGRCELPRVVHAPEFDEACRLSAALESRRNDPPYFVALPHMLWLIGA